MGVEKKIGDFIICADYLPESKGRSVNGKVINENYDGSFDEIYVVENTFVKDQSGKILTPIISSLEVKNDGYVITWSQLFWIQGFAIINNKIYFVLPSDEATDMYGEKGVSYWELNGNLAGLEIKLNRLIKECLVSTPTPEFKESDNPFNEPGSKEYLMQDCMLFDI